TLAATRDQVVGIYHDKTKLERIQLEQMMREETYLTAAEALGKGFINNVTHASPTVQNCPLTDYVNVRDTERLASMLGKRHIVRDVASLLKSIGV
ncbi:MAG: ATP-dependent Clp protease proteolytic subunit, partial [Phycisphaerales bacterium]